MNRRLVRRVAERAGGRCEYCRMPSAVDPLPFQVDHIIAEQHGGQTVMENLAIPVAVKRIRGKLNVPRGRFRTTAAGQYRCVVFP